MVGPGRKKKKKKKSKREIASAPQDGKKESAEQDSLTETLPIGTLSQAGVGQTRTHVRTLVLLYL